MERIAPLICTPSYGGVVTWSYTMSLLNLCLGLQKMGIEAEVWGVQCDSLVPRARNACLAHFYKRTNATHLFLIDGDIKFPPEEAFEFLRSGLDVVCGAYPKKRINWDRMSEVAAAGGTSVEALQLAAVDFVPNPSVSPPTRFEKVNERVYGLFRDAGTGFMCIKREVVTAMITHYHKREYISDMELTNGEVHWDLFPAGVHQGRYESEDYGFCRLWREMGGGVWVSMVTQLAHTGVSTFEGNFKVRYESLFEQK